jgi:GNAT superfamily N-acetyltransferase
MDELRITPVRDEAELRQFISFPWEVYKDDPHWVPPLFSERLEFLDREHNPFFEHATVEYFIARRGDEVVGTIAAITNDRYNEFQEVNVGFFGFFEVLDDPEAAAELLQVAEDWLREAGHDSVLGPAQFSTNDEVGLLVDGFDDPPRILMTYNPPRYEKYVTDAGFVKAKDLWAYRNDIAYFMENFPEKLIRVTEKIKERKNFTIRTLRMKEFDQEVDRLKGIYNRSWEKNWGFVPMTDPEFDHLTKNLKSLIDPSLIFIVEHEGEAVGWSLTLPDLNQPLRKARPHPKTPEWITLLRLVWHWKVRRDVEWLRVFALGVLPEFRGTGVDALLYYETAKHAGSLGYKFAESGWVLEDNEMMNRSAKLVLAEVYKTYRMYEKAL